MESDTHAQLEQAIHRLYKLHPHEAEVLIGLVSKNIQYIPKYVNSSLNASNRENIKWAAKALSSIGKNLNIPQLSQYGESISECIRTQDTEKIRRLVKQVKEIC